MEAKGEWLKLHLRSPTSPSLKDKGPPSGFLSWLDIDPDYKMVLKPHPCHSLDGRLKGAWTAFGKNRVTDGMDEQAWRKPYVFHSIISQTLSMGFSIYFLFFFSSSQQNNRDSTGHLKWYLKWCLSLFYRIIPNQLSHYMCFFNLQFFMNWYFYKI